MILKISNYQICCQNLTNTVPLLLCATRNQPIGFEKFKEAREFGRRRLFCIVAVIRWGFNFAIFAIGINSAKLNTNWNCITFNIYYSRVRESWWCANIYTREFALGKQPRTFISAKLSNCTVLFHLIQNRVSWHNIENWNYRQYHTIVIQVIRLVSFHFHFVYFFIACALEKEILLIVTLSKFMF